MGKPERNTPMMHTSTAVLTTRYYCGCNYLVCILFVQMDYLDTVTEGVQVSRQELGSGQYRWTVTFLDEGDDFELEDVVSRNYLNTTTGDSTEITSTKVNISWDVTTKLIPREKNDTVSTKA